MSAGYLQRVRLVSPEPPYEPEPFPDEPWAPVYSYAPLRSCEGTVAAACARAHADPVVFGPEDTRMLQRRTGYGDGPLRSCEVHAVEWHGKAPCWVCEAPR